ncbi:MAG TPA: CoA-transferase [Hyphomicrobiaceae bacterium]|nr:CoA-transferase [Hyphomicrobiaceae bacterium]
MQIIGAEHAADLIADGDHVLVSGSGGGHAIPERVLEAIEARYLAKASPKRLTLIHVVGLGDRATKGAARLCHDGMLKRSITSALIDSPVMINLASSDKIESYTLPQGVLSQLMRDMAAGRPGLITRTGLHTFVDPRHGGARQSKSAKEDLVELMEIDGREYLRFKPFPIDVAILRGTTADEDGNVSMEQEAIFGEMLSCAQATRRNGGIVIVQVKRMAKRGTLPAKTVKIPGILVDYVVVDPDQRQTYATDYSPAYAGEFRVPLHALKRLPFDVRKIVARRAAMEITPGAICNLGAGISTGISVVATEENILDCMVLTNEQGFIGGAPLTGVDSGASQNYDAIVDQPYQFDFYDGGGLDIAFLSFAEVDPQGSVNISRFEGKIVGIGGFVNISQNAKKVVFSGTFTAGGLEVACQDGSLRIVQEGRHRKFVERIEHVSYSAPFAAQEGRTAVFITERAVFRTVDGALELTEIAPGIDLEKDVLAHMGFRPRVASDVKRMDRRLFAQGPMNLRADLEARAAARAEQRLRRAV